MKKIDQLDKPNNPKLDISIKNSFKSLKKIEYNNNLSDNNNLKFPPIYLIKLINTLADGIVS